MARDGKNVGLYWSVSDKWFRLLEFLLTLGALKYFGDKLHNTPIQILYWLSYIILYTWLLELVDFIYTKLPLKPNKLWPFIITSFVVVGIYSFITGTIQVVISSQF